MLSVSVGFDELLDVRAVRCQFFVDDRSIWGNFGQNCILELDYQVAAAAAAAAADVARSAVFG